jgi:hypothetical protein
MIMKQTIAIVLTLALLSASALAGPPLPMAGIAREARVSYMPDFGEQGYFLNFPSKFISPDGQSLWLCYSANFSPGWNGVKLNFNPQGGRYSLCLHEVKLLKPVAPSPDRP